MKYVVSVSKAYKHRGVLHKKSTKKYWFIYYCDEEGHFHSEQVSYLKAMYYKGHKWKKIDLTCPSCQNTYRHFIKKRTEKAILNEECPQCFEKYKDILEEIENS